MNTVKFGEWITKKYIQWRGDAVGHERTITDFAQELGVSQPLLSQWMAGDKIPRSRNSISQLVKMFGNEAYIALGLPVPDSDRDKIDNPQTEEQAIALIQSLADQFGIPVEIRREEDEDG